MQHSRHLVHHQESGYMFYFYKYKDRQMYVLMTTREELAY